MKSQTALDLIRGGLLREFDLAALDEPNRTKAQYFRTSKGKVFGVVLGELVGGQFSAKTTSIILEPCQLPEYLLARLMIISPYRGSSTHAPSKGIYLKDAQTRVQVADEHALRALLAWYATGTAETELKKNSPVVTDTVKPSLGKSSFPSSVPAKVIECVAVQERVIAPSPAHQEPKRSANLQIPDKGLLIKDPWIEKILNGQKTWEMRSRHTHERGWVALIKSGSGMIYGIARIVDSLGELSETEMLATQDKHGISPQRLPEVPNYRYAWVLADVKRLVKPVPYQHRSGAVIFVLLDEEARAGLAAQIAI